MARPITETGKLNGWSCQRVRGPEGVKYLIERSDRKLHDAPAIIHARIDAAIDGAASAQRKHPRDEIVGKCDAMLRDDVEVPAGCTCSEGGSGWCAACDGSAGNAGVQEKRNG